MIDFNQEICRHFSLRGGEKCVLKVAERAKEEEELCKPVNYTHGEKLGGNTGAL